MKKTGADIFLKSLLSNGVQKVYGYPGGANIPLYDKINQTEGIEHILVRHEQAAAFAAQGQSRSKEGVGICLVTSGPGAANALTGIYDAYMDSIALIFITAQVPLEYMGNDVFQEMDTIGATMSFVKHSFLVKKAQDIPHIINESFKLALSGRPGPVHIDLPKDIQNEICSTNINFSGYVHTAPSFNFNINNSLIEECLSLLNSAKKPLLLIGQGIKLSGAETQLSEFVQKLGIPVVSTLHAKGTLRGDHENYLGMLGMHGFYHANQAIYNSDCIINIGSRFDDRIVGTYESFGKYAKIIHVDIDKSELNKLVKTDISVCCDALHFLQKILQHQKIAPLKISQWKNQITQWKEEHPFVRETLGFSIKNSLNIINNMCKQQLENYTFLTDVGQHQMWSAQILQVASTTSWMTSGGAGTMGFALPTAIGAAFSQPHKTIIVIVGDGGIQMNIQELQLLKEHSLNIKVIIMNNSFLGMVRQWQDLFYEKNYSCTPISSPNFKKLGEAYGLPSYSVDTPLALEECIAKEFHTQGPALIEIKISEKEDNIFPMVCPGSPLKDTITS